MPTGPRARRRTRIAPADDMQRPLTTCNRHHSMRARHRQYRAATQRTQDTHTRTHMLHKIDGQKHVSHSPTAHVAASHG